LRIRINKDLTFEPCQILVDEPCSFPGRVGVGGFEPPTTASQTRCASQLRYTPVEGEYNADSAQPSSKKSKMIGSLMV
jgi:hypothetical protein